MPDVALSASSTRTSTLAVQSMFKLMVSLAKINGDFVINEDEDTLRKIMGGFKKDAKNQYFNLLNDRARDIGLSANGLKNIIKEHIDEIWERRAENSYEILSRDPVDPGQKKRLGTINAKMKEIVEPVVSGLLSALEGKRTSIGIIVYNMHDPFNPRGKKSRLLKITVPDEADSDSGQDPDEYEIIAEKDGEDKIAGIYIKLTDKPVSSESGQFIAEGVFIKLDEDLTDDKDLKNKVLRLKKILGEQIRPIHFSKDFMTALGEKRKEKPDMDEAEVMNLHEHIRKSNEESNEKDFDGSILFSAKDEELTRFLAGSPIARWQLGLRETASVKYSDKFLLVTSLSTRGKTKKRLDLIVGGLFSFIHEMTHCVYAGKMRSQWKGDEYRLLGSKFTEMVRYFIDKRPELLSRLRSHSLYGRQIKILEQDLYRKHGNAEAIKFYIDVNLVVNEIVAHLAERIDSVTTDYSIVGSHEDGPVGLKVEDIEMIAEAGLIPEWYSPKHTGFYGEFITGEYYLKLARHCVENSKETALARRIISTLSENVKTIKWDPASDYWTVEGERSMDDLEEQNEDFFLRVKEHLAVFVKEIILREATWGETFLDTALMRAYEAKKLYDEGKMESPDILIGAETSWIPEEQLQYIQELLVNLSRLSKEKGLDNLIIRRRKGTGLASILAKEAGERGIANSNIIILGEHRVLDDKSFDLFREGVDPEKWALFAGVELPENFPENNYIRLLEMITNALNLWSGKPQPEDTPFLTIVREGRRIYKFIIPEVDPMDYNLLKEIYRGQLKYMRSV